MKTWIKLAIPVAAVAVVLPVEDVPLDEPVVAVLRLDLVFGINRTLLFVETHHVKEIISRHIAP